MSEVAVSESSTVRLKGVAAMPRWVVIAFLVLVPLTIVHTAFGFYAEYWTLPKDWRKLLRAGLLIVCSAFAAYHAWQSRRNSICEVALSEQALVLSSPANQLAIPLSELLSCEVFIERQGWRIKASLLLVTQSRREWVEIYLSRRIDPFEPLHLIIALQENGVELIGVEIFAREIERLTGKSAVGLFDESGSHKAEGSA